MDSNQLEEANEQVYGTGDPIERADNPLVMKFDGTHVPVFTVDDVSIDTLGLPREVLDANRVDQPPTLKEALVAKAERAAQLLELATPYIIQKPEFVST